MLMSHVATHPLSPPLESLRPLISQAKSIASEYALTKCGASRRGETPSTVGPADLESIGGRPVHILGSLPLPSDVFPDRGPSRHRCAGTQLTYANMYFPQ